MCIRDRLFISLSLSLPSQLNLKSDPIIFKDTRQAAYHIQVEQKQLNLKSDPPPEAG